MANRFWVGGGSANTWAATGNTNWAASSGGSNNASVPSTGDVAIFDSNSGTGNSVIGASIAVQGVDCTGGTGSYAGTLTHSAGVTLTINTGASTSLRFSAGMTYTTGAVSSLVTFTNTSGTAQLTSAGQKFAAITVNGVGGTVQQQDNLSINTAQNSTLTITNGIFDCNGNALTSIVVSATNSNTRSFLLGSSVTIGGNASVSTTIWNFTTTTGLTFTKNSANIIVIPPSSPIQSIVFVGGGLTYNGITFNASTSSTECNITGANTFSNFTVNSGWQIQLPNNTTTTISNAFTWTGTPNNPILIGTWGNLGQTTTISVPSGTCTLNWGGLFAVSATGGATFTATNVFNFGTTTGWSITTPADETSMTPAKIATAVWEDLLAGGDFGTAGSIGSLLNTNIDTNIGSRSSPTNITAGTITTVTNLTNAPTSGDLTSTMKTSVQTASAAAITAAEPIPISSNIKKNTAQANFMLVMTDSTTYAPKTGLTVTAQRSLDGGAFANCANSVSELSNGVYVINLATTDTNANHVMLQFTATGANQLNIEIITQP